MKSPTKLKDNSNGQSTSIRCHVNLWLHVGGDKNQQPIVEEEG